MKNKPKMNMSRKGLNKVKTQGREDLPFFLHVEINGERHLIEAKAVIDASGTWTNPIRSYLKVCGLPKSNC
ncbi:hypothetical protein [Paenibacillus alginolyticus]|uniref:hypothetical protein n=1 Tax=Paenibacillus alginolyticus TaxID=59839 RepID=UPI002DBFF347|nr:hypothetical protein [Paenibacillus alginolyticus]MEC0145920.1 hypothetical protein [Paenibacillus alginolyticus]